MIGTVESIILLVVFVKINTENQELYVDDSFVPNHTVKINSCLQNALPFEQLEKPRAIISNTCAVCSGFMFQFEPEIPAKKQDFYLDDFFDGISAQVLSSFRKLLSSDALISFDVSIRTPRPVNKKSSTYKDDLMKPIDIYIYIKIDFLLLAFHVSW